VQQGDSTFERLLYGCGAGDGETDGSELSLGEVFVVVVIFIVILVVLICNSGEGGEGEEELEEQQPSETIH